MTDKNISVPDYLKETRDRIMGPQCQTRQPVDDVLHYCCHCPQGEFEGHGGICPRCGRPSCE